MKDKPRIAALGAQLALAGLLACSEAFGTNSHGFESATITTITPAIPILAKHLYNNLTSNESLL